MTRTSWWRVSGVVAALALITAGVMSGRRLTARVTPPRAPRTPPPAPTYLPVHRETALDRLGTLALPRAAAAPRRSGRPARVIVLGWDGASWHLVLPLLQAGRLPSLRALMSAGAYGNLDTIEPTYSAVIWTSVATGVSPTRHGVLDFVQRPHDRAISRMSPEERGKLHFYSNADRKAKALWNLVSDAGRPVLVVGYHNTYPAEPVKGLMISNYLVREYEIQGFDVHPQRAGGPAAGLVYPPTEARAVAAFHRPLSALRYEEISPFAELDKDVFAQWSASPPKMERARKRWDRLRRGYMYDEFHAQVAVHYLPIIQPALTMLHFQSVDWASHLFLGVYEPPGPAPFAGSRGRQRRSMYGHTVTAFYEYLDAWLGRIQAERDPETTLVVMSDHGFESKLDDGEEGIHDSAPPGILVLQGPGIRAGQRLEGATIYDIMPTLAVLLDLPVARDLPGHVLETALEPAWRQPNPTRWVATYGPRPPQVPQGTSETLDQGLEDDLRAVGYLR